MKHHGRLPAVVQLLARSCLKMLGVLFAPSVLEGHVCKHTYLKLELSFFGFLGWTLAGLASLLVRLAQGVLLWHLMGLCILAFAVGGIFKGPVTWSIRRAER